MVFGLNYKYEIFILRIEEHENYDTFELTF